MPWYVIILLVYTATWRAFLLPLFVGLFILIKYRNQKFCQAAALFALKPVLATPLWAFLYVWNQYHSSFLPGLSITLILVFLYRSLLQTDRAKFMLLIVLDAVRWLYTYFLFFKGIGIAAGEIFDSPWGIASLILPSIYAVIALTLVFSHQKQTKLVG